MMLNSILLLLALIHFYWALGGEHGLDRALPTDDKGNRLLNPSVFITFMVGFILLGFSYVAYQLSVGNTSLWMNRIGWVLAVLFCYVFWVILRWWAYLKKLKVQNLLSMILWSISLYVF
ncbi:hypothetical protein C9926_01895 [Sulfurovum lithotrophicum]|nr:hypothetical protein C9926_01895 [Sulfurovum lithotrophicum]